MIEDERLLSSYKKEKEHYLTILDLAGDLREALKEGHDMPEIISILRRKNRIMEEIDSIENAIEDEKKGYLSSTRSSADMAEIIDELSSLVEKILSVERENEILFSSQGCRSAVNYGAGVSAEYACRRYSGILSGEQS
ncbi:MAG: hypothetical protein JW814_10265 [Candidatus Krumholzibacteriota bacterium]|nr:hypothetical protein [Candidatus Krumholzibacteriota bacterium]